MMTETDLPDGSRCRLILFGKLPEPGRTKTRLAPRLGVDGAARLYQAFLDDAVQTCERVVARRELWVVARPGVEALADRYPRLKLRLQAEGDLGDRLRDAFAASFAAGADRVLIVGSDHPTLPPAYLRRGLQALANVDVSLGPTRDGGYYAVGLGRSGWPRAAALFDGVPWSTCAVLVSTLERARALSLRVARLPSWYDVDEPEQLEALRRQVPASSCTAHVLDLWVEAGR